MGQGVINWCPLVHNKSLWGAGGWFAAGCSVGAVVRVIPTALRSHQEPAISHSLPRVVFVLGRELMCFPALGSICEALDITKVKLSPDLWEKVAPQWKEKTQSYFIRNQLYKSEGSERPCLFAQICQKQPIFTCCSHPGPGLPLRCLKLALFPQDKDPLSAPVSPARDPQGFLLTARQPLLLFSSNQQLQVRSRSGISYLQVSKEEVSKHE